MTRFFAGISHEFARRRLLADYRAGRISRDKVCDADFLLRAAAQFHGYPNPRICPVCEEQELTTIYWIYGAELGRASGSARSLEEIDSFTASGKTFTVHTVEVCSLCQWNHLVLSREAAPDDAG